MQRRIFQTADLCDAHEDLQVLAPLFRDLGGAARFCGAIATLSCFEDNSLVRQALSEPGDGRVLVVDGGGSLGCALVGDVLGGLAVENGWSGIVVHGCVRDAAALAELDLGVRALATCPRKSVKRGEGRRGLTLRFAGARLVEGHHLWADADGIVVAERDLLA